MRIGSILGVAVLVSGWCPLSGQAAGAASDTYTIDSVHSAVLFRIKHLDVSHCYGRFNDISGSVAFDPAAPESGSFNVKLNADSIDTNNSKRDKHLKSPDFFNAKEFKTITFISNSVKKVGENKYEVKGDLSLHGVTKALTTTFDRVGATEGGQHGRRIGFETEFTIQRSEFDMTGYMDSLGDEVKVIVSMEAIHGEEAGRGKSAQEKKGS